MNEKNVNFLIPSHHTHTHIWSELALDHKTQKPKALHIKSSGEWETREN